MSSMGDSANIIPVLRQHFGADDSRIHTGVEVGVHRGALSAALLTEFKQLMLYMVDSWAEHPEGSAYRKSGDSLAKLTYDDQTAHMLAAKAATEFAARRRQTMRTTSLNASKRVPCPRIAFVFLDGSHTYEDVRDDITAWWPRVEKGGLLAGHDYGHRRHTGVKKAVDEWSEAAGVQTFRHGSVWVAVKPGELFIPPPPDPEVLAASERAYQKQLEEEADDE
jgi:hypothetical protein